MWMYSEYKEDILSDEEKDIVRAALDGEELEVTYYNL